MEATAENLKTFLEKRGYEAEVSKDADTFFVSITSSTVEEVAKLLASIREPGRYIVSVQVKDLANLIVNQSGIPEQIQEIKESLERTMTRNVDNLIRTDTELERQSKDSISGIYKTLDEVKEDIAKALQVLSDRISILEGKPWWKKW